MHPATEPVLPLRLAQTDAPQRPRVLHVINGEHYAGAERVQDLLALRLPEHGFDVGFVALKPGRFGDARRSVAAPLDELAMGSRWDLRSVSHVRRAIREGGYTLVHAHTPRTALIGSLAAQWCGVPFVYHAHSPTCRDSTRPLQNWLNDRVEWWSLRGASRVIAVSPTLVDHFAARGFDPNRVTCVLNGVPTDPDAKPRLRPCGAWTLGMVALFRPRKGAEVLLEALAAARSCGHDVRLQAIGPFETPAYQETLLHHARRLGLERCVEWTGFAGNVAEQLRRVDALVLPSLFGEGLPMVVLEAMAVGLPVLASRCEGVGQAVLHRQTGLLVEPGSVSQLTRAIADLVTGQFHYESCSREALARQRERFSDHAMARQVAQAYRGVLGMADAEEPAGRGASVAVGA